MDKHIRAAQRFYRQVKEQQGIKVLQIGEDELQALLKDKERLDFIEKDWCTVDDGINEIKVNMRIIVGQTELRKAIDQVMEYKEEDLKNDE